MGQAKSKTANRQYDDRTTERPESPVGPLSAVFCHVAGDLPRSMVTHAAPPMSTPVPTWVPVDQPKMIKMMLCIASTPPQYATVAGRLSQCEGPVSHRQLMWRKRMTQLRCRPILICRSIQH